MWDTSQGVRTLRGAEAYLIKELVHYLHDQILVGIDIDEPHHTGVAVFDSLQPTQQLMMLLLVAQGLLDQDVPPQKLTAPCEGTIYVIFLELMTLIEAEIGFQQTSGVNDHRLRSLARKAYAQSSQALYNPEQLFEVEPKQFGNDDDDSIPIVASVDMDQWILLVERLADNILWDRDFELEQLVGDVSPDYAHLIKRQLGINHDYYATVASDIRDIDVDPISQLIRNLTPATEYTV